MKDDENNNDIEQESNLNFRDEELSVKNNLIWLFCPVCGNKLPNVKKLKFCIKCGFDIEYFRTHQELPPSQDPKLSHVGVSFQEEQSSYKTFFSTREKISDEDLYIKKEQKLWGSSASIGIPLLSFILMTFLAAFLSLFVFIFSLNFQEFQEMILSPYFLIISSLAELMFILIPVLFVGRYLQNPTLKNRFVLLGFSFEGYGKKGVLKEILIGLGFALIGIFLVVFVSFSIESLLELIFRVEIVPDSYSSVGDLEMLISSGDLLSLVLLVLIMIFVIGTSEELIFRGFMQKGLVRSWGKIIGIIITALIFSMIHLIGLFLIIPFDSLVFLISFILSFLPYFALSLMLGLLFYWRKENLIAVMITHGFYNAITLIIVYISFGL